MSAISYFQRPILSMFCQKWISLGLCTQTWKGRGKKQIRVGWSMKLELGLSLVDVVEVEVRVVTLCLHCPRFSPPVTLLLLLRFWPGNVRIPPPPLLQFLQRSTSNSFGPTHLICHVKVPSISVTASDTSNPSFTCL